MTVESNEKATKKLGGVTGRGFMPGKSGNPGGRKKEYDFKKALNEALNETDEKTKQLNIVAIVNKAVSMAKGGDMKAITWIANRLEGIPRQSLDVNTNEMGAINIWTTIRDKDGNEIWTTEKVVEVEKLGEHPEATTIK